MRYRLLAGAMAMIVASPALADHAGASGGYGAGGALNVLAPDTLDEGAGSAEARFTYLRPQQRSDGELTKLASQHVHAHNTDYNLSTSIGASYGVTDSLTVSAELPYIRRDDIQEGEHAHSGGQTTNQVVRLGTVAGIGDASLVAKYKFTDGKLSAALIGGLKMPTGSTHRRSVQGERLETEHQPGTGSWDPIFGAASAINGRSLRFTASAIYEFSTKGAQRTRLGDRFEGGIALSRQFGPADHHHGEANAPEDSSSHGHDEVAHGHASWDAFVAMTVQWEGRQRVAGEIEDASGGTSVWVSPGARFNSARGVSAAVALGMPVWQRIQETHPENSFRTTFSVACPF
jgi:hypothetical protein